MDRIQERILELITEKNACCAQILMQMVALDPLGRKDPDLFRAMGGLCHGMHCQYTCGALTGAACALAMRTGDKGRLNAWLEELGDWFEEEFGTVSCMEIIGQGVSSTPQCAVIIEATVRKCLSLVGDDFRH